MEPDDYNNKMIRVLKPLQTQEEADNVMEEFRMSNFVLLTGHETPSVKVFLESAWRMQDRKVDLDKVVEYIYKNLSSSEPVSLSSRTDSKAAGSSSLPGGGILHHILLCIFFFFSFVLDLYLGEILFFIYMGVWGI